MSAQRNPQHEIHMQRHRFDALQRDYPTICTESLEAIIEAEVMHRACHGMVGGERTKEAFNDNRQAALQLLNATSTLAMRNELIKLRGQLQSGTNDLAAYLEAINHNICHVQDSLKGIAQSLEELAQGGA